MIVDKFAGPGGWAEGFRLLGLSEVGLEWDRFACATRVAAGHRMTVRCDVAAYPTAPFAGRIKVDVNSPPCQAWSRAGKGLGLVDQPLVHQAVADLAAGRDTRAQLLAACKDPRSLLAAEPMRWHHDLRPETILMEEVPDVLPLWKQYAAILRRWGYSVWCGILCAADYGVPQTRRRAILIASRVRDIAEPPRTHYDPKKERTRSAGGQDSLFAAELLPYITMAEALGWVDGLIVNTRGERKTPGGNEFPADRPSWALTEKTRSWVLHTNRGNVRADGERQLIDPQGQPAPVVTTKTGEQWVLRTGNNTMKHSRTGSRRGEGGVVAYERDINEPAPTLDTNVGGKWTLHRPATTVCATDRIAPPGHRDRNPGGESQFASSDTVRITQAEAAVLQSFLADYPWQGTKTKQFEQIGNAVPPLLAAHIAAAGLGIDIAEALANRPREAAA
ncbi:MAG TPA: DNA cytosine methyltransferase [Streptomyces sp.]